MKLKLMKKNIKTLSNTNRQLDNAQTPNVAGGFITGSVETNQAQIASFVNECHTATCLTTNSLVCNSGPVLCDISMNG
ncbi:hypothetical protein ACSLBF_20945 (plasmid) [Pseudoalteromonas sp. T1lg65]|uniref:hypothetical protein n=1 Tax=Pseudoalteromonas sp. T1lg65 TaxID=2077101 RepID=UPI003F78B459